MVENTIGDQGDGAGWLWEEGGLGRRKWGEGEGGGGKEGGGRVMEGEGREGMT